MISRTATAHTRSRSYGSCVMCSPIAMPQVGQLLREAHELVELRLLLPGAELRVVEVLAAPGLVDTGRLELRARPRRDPDVLPGRRDHELLDALDLGGIVDPPAATVQVAKASLRPRAPPSTSARHAGDLPDRREYHPPPMDQRTIVVLEGDETGQELLEEGLRTLAPDVIGIELSVPALRPLAGEAARDEERGRQRGRARDPGARPRPEGRHDHAGDARRRRLAEPDPP